MKAWNAHPVHGMSGDQLASVVHWMLRDVNTAVSIPLVVSHAAKGDYGPLEHADSGDLDIGDLNLMGASIWCSEPWAGLDAKGPWGTDFDSYTTALIANFRQECSSVPKRAEPRSLWTLPLSSRTPVIALVGGADPQDPVTNLSDLKRHFPDSRTVVLPHLGHDLSWDGGVRWDAGGLRRPRHHERSGHDILRRRGRGAAVPADRLNQTDTEFRNHVR